jgi:hypothetical protein
MTGVDNSGEHYPGNGAEIYRELADQIAYVFDDAFNMEAEKLDEDRRRLHEGKAISTVEILQMDTASLGHPAFTVLLTASGGKPVQGTEKIRLYAYSTDNYEHVLDAAIANQSEGGMLAYHTHEFFIGHQDVLGSWRYSKTDGTTITPWVPMLATVPTEQVPEGIDIISAVISARSEVTEVDEQLAKVNVEYAHELHDKICGWTIVPQN